MPPPEVGSHSRRAGALALGALAAVTATTSARILRAGRRAPLAKADAIFVFGAAVGPAGPSLAVRVRVEQAARVYADGWAPLVLCSGGWSNGESEATLMRRMLIERGVPPGAVIVDDKGTSTRRAIRSARRYGGWGWTRVIAVSSPYHLLRIRSEAKRQGLAVILCPARPAACRPRRLFASGLRQHVRELVAVPSYAFTSLLGANGRPARSLRAVFGEIDSIFEASELISDHIMDAAGGGPDTEAAMTPGAAALTWPVSGHVTSPFGLRARRLHAGIDILCDHGVPVTASGAGTVVLAERVGPLGNVVVIEHGGGLSTVYAHLDALEIEPTETVASGQAIGRAGATGRSFGPHLHFEVRVHGSPVDPLSYLS